MLANLDNNSCCPLLPGLFLFVFCAARKRMTHKYMANEKTTQEQNG